MIYVRLFYCAAIALISFGAYSQSNVLSPSVVTKLAQASFKEYLEFLSMPSDAIVPEDIQKNTDFIEQAFKKRRFTTKQLANSGKPMLYAEFAKKIPGAKTILFYMHLDGQPVVPAEWAQKNPWVPVVKQRNASGQWEEIGQDRLFADVLDPDLRVFGRASSDDKGPIMMFLAAFDGLNAAAIAPSFNVKVLLDTEEEKGSPSIPAVVKANRELLRNDGIVVHDGPRHASDRPTLIFGNRGNTRTILTVFGPRAPLHSGHYGNYVPNPAMRLAQVLASMKDEQGRVLVAGYYDRIKLSPDEKKILAETGDDEAEIRRRTGIAKAEIVGNNYQEALQYPSLNIRGMAAASVGAKASNIIPHQAVAELDLRTTPETPPTYLFGLIEEHLKKLGYHLVKGQPTDAERASYDKLASFSMGTGGRAVRTPMDSPLGAWAYTSLRKASSTAEPAASPVRIRMMGGSVPTDSLVEILEAPFVIIPMVNGDNNQHSFDENMRIGHYVEGIRTMLGLLRTPY
jgi:acetylornithine deacetylase/succinyl-diaminopimelate desuccinylase-like protein